MTGIKERKQNAFLYLSNDIVIMMATEQKQTVILKLSFVKDT